MSRGFLSASTLAAAALAGMFSLSACARDAEPAPIRLAQAPAGNWKLGTHYTLLEQPQPTNVAGGKVEVDEVFWYGCGHCYALDPTLESWKTAGKPAYVEFVRIPVIWGPTHRQHAKLYYTIQALGRPDLHAKIFDAIHKDGKPLAAQRDEDARAMALEFFKDHGVTEKDFNAAYDSMSVATNLQHAQDMTLKYQVSSVPMMIVGGKFTTGVSAAGGAPELISLVDDLAAREKAR